jgi:4-hydroxy-tetrahydrodipicolinate reductase
MTSTGFWLFLVINLSWKLVLAFRPVGLSHKISTSRLEMTDKDFAIMVNGMPGPMALEVAKVCLDRGLPLAPIGFTGPDVKEPFIIVEGKEKKQKVELIRGPPNESATAALKSLKKQFPGVVLVDYTHPSAIIGNLQCYIENDCDFVMGTTGGDPTKMNEIFNKGSNFAVIAPNMGKQIVAMQAALLEMAKRFPGSFKGYKLTVSNDLPRHRDIPICAYPMFTLFKHPLGDGISSIDKGRYFGNSKGKRDTL